MQIRLGVSEYLQLDKYQPAQVSQPNGNGMNQNDIIYQVCRLRQQSASLLVFQVYNLSPCCYSE